MTTPKVETRDISMRDLHSVPASTVSKHVTSHEVTVPGTRQSYQPSLARMGSLRSRKLQTTRKLSQVSQEPKPIKCRDKHHSIFVNDHVITTYFMSPRQSGSQFFQRENAR